MSARWGILPVKGFGLAKSRLRTVVDPETRATLARGLYERAVASLAPHVDVLAIVSDDPDVRADAAARGATLLADPAGATNLGDVVRGSLVTARGSGATEAIVLMADLPRVSAEAVGLMANLAVADSVVVSRDRHGMGTNALRVPLPAPYAVVFGHEESGRRNLLAADAAGASVVELRHPALALDLDTPSDLAAYSALPLGPASARISAAAPPAGKRSR